MNRGILIGLTGISAIATSLAAAAPTAPAEYLVEVAMTEGSAPPTHPRLTVRAGETATFMIGNERYGLTMTARTETGNRVTLHSTVATWTPAGLEHHSDSIRLNANGEHGVVTFASTDPGSGATNQVRLDVTVRPVG